MKLDQLMQFMETARQQHLSRAAAILRVSPSAVSYGIQCLEEELGVALFEKRGRRIFLTDAGRRLLRKIPEVQRSLSDLKSHVSSGAVYEGYCRMGASHVLADTWLAPAAARLFRSSPSAIIEVVSLRSAEVLAHVLDERIQLGVCFSPQEHPRLNNRVLYTGHLKIYVRKRHPLLKSQHPLKSLSSYPAALPKAFGGIDVCESHEVFAAHGIKPTHRFGFDHYGVASSLVNHSDAWGFLVDWLERAPHFPLVPLPLPKTWKAPYKISAVYLRDRFLDPALEKLIETGGVSVSTTNSFSESF